MSLSNKVDTVSITYDQACQKLHPAHSAHVQLSDVVNAYLAACQLIEITCVKPPPDQRLLEQALAVVDLEISTLSQEKTKSRRFRIRSGTYVIGLGWLHRFTFSPRKL
jgi:hypothetical protein